MQTDYKKALIFLDGVNAKNSNSEIMESLVYCFNALHIPFQFVKENREGFVKFQELLNQEDTLYVLNDSACFHICDKPNILLTRSPLWVQSTVQKNTIGVFTNETLVGSESEFIACIARNTPVMQPADLYAPHNYILTSEYESTNLDTIARNGIAATSWRILAAQDIHSEVLFQKPEKDEIPFVNKILEEGLESLERDDDIIIFINRDICLVPQATTIIRNYMENHHLDAISARRVDVDEYRVHSYEEIKSKPQFVGIDLFAFKRNATVLEKILPIDLYIGKYFWDTYWNVCINHELPYNIAYHIKHESDWMNNVNSPENTHNREHTHLNLDGVTFSYSNSKRY
jgi:hypothetical protein